jgi:prevent-host-death family protein
MTAVSLEVAQAKLPELIERLAAGEELLITQHSRPVAKLVAADRTKPVPVFGSGRGKVISIVDDDEHLADFAEYMP